MKFQIRAFRIVAATAAMLLSSSSLSRADVLESWNNPTDNSFDGWSIPPKYCVNNYANFIGSYSTTLGVTDGSSALVISSTSTGQAARSGPDYSQMLASEYLQNWTKILSHAAGIQFDVYTPAGSFGNYLQWDVDLDNADAGYHSLYNYNYVSSPIGTETTLKFYFSPPAGLASSLFAGAKPTPQAFCNSVLTQNAACQAVLASSVNPTGIFIAVGGGYSAGHETMYVDNLSAFYQPGDFNFDHHTDARDILAMETCLANPSGYTSTNSLTNNDLLQIGDLNGDHKVNNADLQSFLKLLKSGGATTDAIPEPSSIVLLLLFLLAFASSQARKHILPVPGEDLRAVSK